MPLYISKGKLDKGTFMGLSALQFSLCMYTQEKARNELATMRASNNKMALSRAQSELSQEYYSKLQSKKLNYYHNGAYVPISYSYLMGDASHKDAHVFNMGYSMLNPEIAAEYGVSSANVTPTKTDSSIILTDYRGLVVLNGEYAKAIQNTLGPGVYRDGDGRGTTFNQTAIPEIIANYVGYTPGSDMYEAFMAVYNNDKTKMESLGLTGVIDGSKINGEVVKNGLQIKNRADVYKATIDFYKPIFQACATNGWTTEYTSQLPDSDYISNALTSGIFQLATVDKTGNYEAGTNLQYYLNAAFVTERRDSVEQEELTAWYNKEKAKIAEKEDQWDIELQNLSTERSALETQIESIESLIDKAIEVFNWGA